MPLPVTTTVVPTRVHAWIPPPITLPNTYVHRRRSGACAICATVCGILGGLAGIVALGLTMRMWMPFADSRIDRWGFGYDGTTNTTHVHALRVSGNEAVISVQGQRNAALALGTETGVDVRLTTTRDGNLVLDAPARLVASGMDAYDVAIDRLTARSSLRAAEVIVGTVHTDDVTTTRLSVRGVVTAERARLSGAEIASLTAAALSTPGLRVGEDDVAAGHLQPHIAQVQTLSVYDVASNGCTRSWMQAGKLHTYVDGTDCGAGTATYVSTVSPTLTEYHTLVIAHAGLSARSLATDGYITTALITTSAAGTHVTGNTEIQGNLNVPGALSVSLAGDTAVQTLRLGGTGPCLRQFVRPDGIVDTYRYWGTCDDLTHGSVHSSIDVNTGTIYDHAAHGARRVFVYEPIFYVVLVELWGQTARMPVGGSACPSPRVTLDCLHIICDGAVGCGQVVSFVDLYSADACRRNVGLGCCYCGLG